MHNDNKTWAFVTPITYLSKKADSVSFHTQYPNTFSSLITTYSHGDPSIFDPQKKAIITNNFPLVETCQLSLRLLSFQLTILIKLPNIFSKYLKWRLCMYASKMKLTNPSAVVSTERFDLHLFIDPTWFQCFKFSYPKSFPTDHLFLWST